MPSWWLNQPIWNIWNIQNLLPNFSGWTFQKYLKPTPIAKDPFVCLWWSGISRKQSYDLGNGVQTTNPLSGSSVDDFSKGPRNLWDSLTPMSDPPLPFPFPGILIGTGMGVWEWARQLSQETHLPRWFKGGISFILGLFKDCWNTTSKYLLHHRNLRVTPRCHPFRNSGP